MARAGAMLIGIVIMSAVVGFAYAGRDFQGKEAYNGDKLGSAKDVVGGDPLSGVTGGVTGPLTGALGNVGGIVGGIVGGGLPAVGGIGGPGAGGIHGGGAAAQP